MTAIPKDAPWRSKEYRQWIVSLPCCACGAPADDAHHLTGTGRSGMGTKPGDNYIIPLCRGHHTMFHNEPFFWESMFGKQEDHLDRIVELARKEKKLDPFLCFSTGLENDL